MTLIEAAQILRISPATVKNWLKAGVLKSTDHVHVKQTQQQIKNGKLKKLQSGANKHHSLKVHSHIELLNVQTNATALKPLLEKYQNKKKHLLLAVYLKQLVHCQLIGFDGSNFIIPTSIKPQLAEWKIDIEAVDLRRLCKDIWPLEVDWSDHLLSYIYQSANATAAKQDLGAYYTPAAVVTKALSSVKEAGTLCDPCCGSGNFIAAAYLQMKQQKIRNAEDLIFGYDCDLLAVLTARANLTLASAGRINVMKAVQLRNFLMNQPMAEFDYITTNPPWGSFADGRQTLELRNKFGFKSTKDSFSFFLATSLQNLKLGGAGHFILPVSFMNVRTHAEIRKFIFSNFTVHSVLLLDEKFSGVMTRALLIHIQNKKPTPGHNVTITSNGVCKVQNSQILQGPEYSIPLYNDNKSLKVISEIESGSVATLAGQCKFGLGLVTGNNEKLLFKSAMSKRVPVIRGSEVFRYRQPNPEYFCNSDLAAFQQAAPESVYRARKKLIYRFICKELVFAIDHGGQYTLNSANILIPEDSRYSCEFLCALFNSKLGQFYFSKKFSSIKVLRSHLEAFPLPAYDQKLFAAIEHCTEILAKGYNSKTAAKADDLIFKAYGLSNEAKALIVSHPVNESLNG